MKLIQEVRRFREGSFRNGGGVRKGKGMNKSVVSFHRETSLNKK